jgi:hypothetical protein
MTGESSNNNNHAFSEMSRLLSDIEARRKFSGRGYIAFSLHLREGFYDVSMGEIVVKDENPRFGKSTFYTPYASSGKIPLAPGARIEDVLEAELANLGDFRDNFYLMLNSTLHKTPESPAKF